MKEIFEKLHRPINPAGYITEIDGFRFFAIFTVCLLHLNNFFGRSIGYDYYQGVKDINSWSWFINRCGLGVELFFLSSLLSVGRLVASASLWKGRSFCSK